MMNDASHIVNRRGFFKALGAGVLVLYLAPVDFAQESGGSRRRFGAALPSDINAWLHIGEDGIVTVYTGKTEVGQNIRTSLTQAVAEELRAPAASRKMVMADTELTPYDFGTFGSQTTPQMASRLHRVAAAAREALLDLAADRFKADRGTLVVADGKIFKGAGGDGAGFGELTKGQKLVKTIDDNTPITPATKWSIAGTSLPKVNGRDFVTGRHKYASDIKREGMLHGKVLRATSFEAALDSVDTSAADAMPGVKVVRDGDFIGVTGPDGLSATHAVGAIHAKWTTKPQPSSTGIFDYIRKNAGEGGGRGAINKGSVETGMAAATHKLTQTYTVAYIAHVPLEPRAAVAEWNGDKLTIWMGSQRPFGVRDEVAQAFGLKNEQVRVIVPDTGSGYGGKHTAEAAIEAARLAKGSGKPVKLVWTRQEEFTWAYFRPAGVIDVSSGAGNDGVMTAWEFHNYLSGPSALGTPYNIANQKCEFHGAKSPLRTGSYRGLAATANHFARETHIDEMAAALKMDPLEFRLKNLTDERLKAVLEAAAEAFGWGKRKAAAGHGFGMACGVEKGGHVATFAEVAADVASGGVKVLRATQAFDCGAVVNPNHLKNQLEGAMIMGLGGALFESIEFADGKIGNARLAEYRVPRFEDAPKIEIVLVDRKDLPSAGAGETGIVGIAPAVGNAIFSATGIRLRSMPLVPDGLKA